MTTQISEAELQEIEAITPAPSGTPSERFLGACVEWAEEWIRANANALSKVKVPASQSVVFLFSETPELEREALTNLGTLNERVHRVTVAQDTQGVILCNENLQQMIRIMPCLASVDAALEFASTKIPADRTFVIINFAQRRLYVHRSGDDPVAWIDTLVPTELSFQDAPLSADRIEKGCSRPSTTTTSPSLQISSPRPCGWANPTPISCIRDRRRESRQCSWSH